MHTSDQKKKTANIGVVLTDPDDWTATAFMKNLRKRGANAIPVMNSPTAIQNAANKFFSFYLFKQAQLPIPHTVVTSDLGVALKATKEFESAVAKPIFGSQGKGIVKLGSTQPDLKQKLATLLKERGVLYLQAFVPNPGRDIRVFVVGEEALGAIYRISQTGSFIT